MLKIIGCLVAIGASTAVGFSLGDNLKKRYAQLREVSRALSEIESEIIYTHTSLPETIKHISEKMNFPINESLSKIAESLYLNEVENVYEAFENVFNKNNKSLKLEKEDIDIILALAKSLGESDVDSQKRIFDITIDNLKKQIEFAESNMSKNLKMYRYLGFSFGAVVTILLI